MRSWKLLLWVLIAVLLASCQPAAAPAPAAAVPATIAATATLAKATATPAPALTAATDPLAAFRFPAKIDPTRRYLFYLHGKILEDQGLPAISPEFGEYEYIAILEKLQSFDFIVISELRGKDTDGNLYAQKTAGQVSDLLAAGVPAGHITVVGASKGAGITMLISNRLQNPQLNFVLLGSCDPGTVTELVQNHVTLSGNILAIYDQADTYAGSCQALLAASAGPVLGRQREIRLEIGSGHGLLYRPLDAWVLPTIEWAQEEP